MPCEIRAHSRFEGEVAEGAHGVAACLGVVAMPESVRQGRDGVERAQCVLVGLVRVG